MSPQQLLAHLNSGELWPEGAGAAFTELPAAYATALAVRRLRISGGDVPRGFKVGFTNRTIWPRYQVFAPIWGTVWSSSLSFCEGTGRLSLAGTCQPRIEPEAVFGLKAVPPPDASLQDLFEALDWVAPGFEIVQCHLPDWKFAAPQTVADSGLHARLLVGAKQPVAALAPSAAALQARLAAASVQLGRNGEVVDRGRGANVLGDPLAALLHFVRELRACPGAPELQPGDVVTTGTWTDAFPVRPGQRWAARFDDALPALEVAFD